MVQCICPEHAQCIWIGIQKLSSLGVSLEVQYDVDGHIIEVAISPKIQFISFDALKLI